MPCSPVGFKPQLAYNIALCHYQQRQYPQSLKYISDVIEHGIREHPELGVGMTTEGIEVRSVGTHSATYYIYFLQFTLFTALFSSSKNHYHFNLQDYWI